jgi:glutamate-1-semialdehyde 2,1-aminomutase
MLLTHARKDAVTTLNQLYEQAQRYLAGGVSATARANAAIGHPLYVSRGDGPRIWDVDGREYIDMCMSHGASLLGHNHPRIKAALAKALDLGIICSYETEHHVALARRITELVPCAELVRFAGSGTETVMHALRLARSATGRDKIIKFEGHFHGYADALNFSAAPPLDQAGPAQTPVAYPESSGIPASARGDIVIIPFNDEAALDEAFAAHGGETAALMLEPINYDQGCIVPQPGFLQRCRELCDRYGVVLFYDEVLTAFRMASGGAQQYLGVTPDLCVLGKAFGGGTPISAVAGRREIMQHLRPLGRSEWSGTYLAHLTTVLGALAALEEYSRPGFYERLQAVSEHFYAGFQELIDRSGVPVRLQYVGPRFGMYFGIRDPVTNYRQAALKDRALEHAFIAGCYRRGVYLAVSPHHGFSAAHTLADMDRVLAAMAGAMEDVKRVSRESVRPCPPAGPPNSPRP